MARQQSDREDLLAEAAGLLPRGELLVPNFADPVVVGARGNQAWSLYFGPDLVYHFNSAGELRRAFADERIVKAEAEKLVSLTKQQDATAVNLLRHEFTREEQGKFMDVLTTNVRSLLAAVDSGKAKVLREIPAEGELLKVLRQWLDRLELPPAVASVPNVS